MSSGRPRRAATRRTRSHTTSPILNALDSITSDPDILAVHGRKTARSRSRPTSPISSNDEEKSKDHALVAPRRTRSRPGSPNEGDSAEVVVRRSTRARSRPHLTNDQKSKVPNTVKRKRQAMKNSGLQDEDRDSKEESNELDSFAPTHQEQVDPQDDSHDADDETSKQSAQDHVEDVNVGKSSPHEHHPKEIGNSMVGPSKREVNAEDTEESKQRSILPTLDGGKSRTELDGYPIEANEDAPIPFSTSSDKLKKLSAARSQSLNTSFPVDEVDTSSGEKVTKPQHLLSDIAPENSQGNFGGDSFDARSDYDGQNRRGEKLSSRPMERTARQCISSASHGEAVALGHPDRRGRSDGDFGVHNEHGNRSSRMRESKLRVNGDSGLSCLVQGTLGRAPSLKSAGPEESNTQDPRRSRRKLPTEQRIEQNVESSPEIAEQSGATPSLLSDEDGSKLSQRNHHGASEVSSEATELSKSAVPAPGAAEGASETREFEGARDTASLKCLGFESRLGSEQSERLKVSDNEADEVSFAKNQSCVSHSREEQDSLFDSLPLTSIEGGTSQTALAEQKGMASNAALVQQRLGRPSDWNGENEPRKRKKGGSQIESRVRHELTNTEQKPSFSDSKGFVERVNKRQNIEADIKLSSLPSAPAGYSAVGMGSSISSNTNEDTKSVVPTKSGPKVELSKHREYETTAMGIENGTSSLAGREEDDIRRENCSTPPLRNGNREVVQADSRHSQSTPRALEDPPSIPSCGSEEYSWTVPQRRSCCVDNTRNSSKDDTTGSGKFAKLKVALFAAGLRAHRGKGAEKLFADYWQAVRFYVRGRGDPSPRLPEGWFMGTRRAMDAFLKTRKMRRLHNDLFLELVERSSIRIFPNHKIETSIPDSWRSRLKAHRDADAPASESLGLHSKSELWFPGASEHRSNSLPGKIETAHLSLSTKEVQVSRNSADLPGVLSVDPVVRRAAQKAGLKIAENGVWLIVVAIREYISSVLRKVIESKIAITEGEITVGSTLAASQSKADCSTGAKADERENAVVLLTKRRCITPLDIASFIAGTPCNSRLGGTESRVAFERCLAASFKPVFAVPQQSFDDVHGHLSNLVAEVQNKRQKLHGDAFVPSDKQQKQQEASLPKVASGPGRPPARRGAKDLIALRQRTGGDMGGSTGSHAASSLGNSAAATGNSTQNIRESETRNPQLQEVQMFGVGASSETGQIQHGYRRGSPPIQRPMMPVAPPRNPTAGAQQNPHAYHTTPGSQRQQIPFQCPGPLSAQPIHPQPGRLPQTHKATTAVAPGVLVNAAVGSGGKVDEGRRSPSQSPGACGERRAPPVIARGRGFGRKDLAAMSAMRSMTGTASGAESGTVPPFAEVPPAVTGSSDSSFLSAKENQKGKSSLDKRGTGVDNL